MYAIVEIAGQQFKVEKEQEIFVHRLAEEAGAAVEFDQVLLLDNAGKVTVGTPTVNGALIRAKVIEHLKGDKVIVFHKKRRKGYQKENGHRQSFSKLVIEDILTDAKKAEKKAAPKKEAAAPKAAAKPEAKAEKKAAPKAEKAAAPKAEAKKETKAPAKKAPAKAAAKKAAPKAEKKAAAPKAVKKKAPEAKDKKEDQ